MLTDTRLPRNAPTLVATRTQPSPLAVESDGMSPVATSAMQLMRREFLRLAAATADIARL